MSFLVNAIRGSSRIGTTLSANYVHSKGFRTALTSHQVAQRQMSSKCHCAHDQTPEQSMEFLKKDRTALGTALFLVPDPEKGVMESKVVVVKDLTYEEATKRGINCEGIKWLANNLISHNDIVEERKSCVGEWCGPNRNWCRWPCMCGNGNFCV